MAMDDGVEDHVVDVKPGETIEIGEAVQEGREARCHRRSRKVG
jgi:hypothetical protein